jgi:hypothetical protein
MKYKEKRNMLFIPIFILILAITFTIILLIKPNSCADGTKNNECSDINPYFCESGKLVEKASICGCPVSSMPENESCISEYQTVPEERQLKYVLNGKEGYIDFVVYRGLSDYFSKLPRHIDSEENLTLADFKLRMINDEVQKGFLFPLFLEISKITSNKEDRVRIAISLVQNIPFGSSNKTLNLGRVAITYQRYPYEVLYDNQGICSEKSELLFFLLREMGYGTASLYYVKENHEVVGIKCPVKQSVDYSGYCFVETTGPSIIGDDQTDYFGETRNLNSTPIIINISEGIALGNNLREYKDSDALIKIRDKVNLDGEINLFDSLRWNSLKKRYGLVSFGYYQFD